MTQSPAAQTVRLFVYGKSLASEPEHGLLQGARCLGAVKTQPRYTLVDLGVYPALLETGATSVVGELYLVTREVRFTLDVKHECPALFQRTLVELSDGAQVEAYVMREEQVRGRRRIKNGDWCGRFALNKPEIQRSAFVEALRRR
jgi:gamma-glutamylcyclotransferase (GGCT)/AIG2-like uncharacterized protein YtfP